MSDETNEHVDTIRDSCELASNSYIERSSVCLLVYVILDSGEKNQCLDEL